jgi:hypothetical protein
MSTEQSKQPDFRVDNHGSILVLKPLTAAAKEWVADHLAHPETQTWGGGTVVEPRFMEAIVQGIQDDGLEVAL